MLITDLPNGLKELAEKRRREWKKDSSEDYLLSAFFWNSSIEGTWFWGTVSIRDFRIYNETYPNHEWTLDYLDEYYIDSDNTLHYKEDWLKMERYVFESLDFTSTDIARGYYAGIPTEPKVIESFAKGFDVAISNIGVKDLANKADYSEINLDILDLMAERFTANKHKYPKNNMKKDIELSKLEWALFRHTKKIVSPKQDDPESYKDHLSAILCNCSMILDQINKTK